MSFLFLFTSLWRHSPDRFCNVANLPWPVWQAFVAGAELHTTAEKGVFSAKQLCEKRAACKIFKSCEYFSIDNTLFEPYWIFTMFFCETHFCLFLDVWVFFRKFYIFFFIFRRIFDEYSSANSSSCVDGPLNTSTFFLEPFFSWKLLSESTTSHFVRSSLGFAEIPTNNSCCYLLPLFWLSRPKKSFLRLLHTSSLLRPP